MSAAPSINQRVVVLQQGEIQFRGATQSFNTADTLASQSPPQATQLHGSLKPELRKVLGPTGVRTSYQRVLQLESSSSVITTDKYIGEGDGAGGINLGPIISNASDPLDSQDLATKNYVDNQCSATAKAATQGLTVKNAVKYAISLASDQHLALILPNSGNSVAALAGDGTGSLKNYVQNHTMTTFEAPVGAIGTASTDTITFTSVAGLEVGMVLQTTLSDGQTAAVGVPPDCEVKTIDQATGVVTFHQSDGTVMSLASPGIDTTQQLFFRRQTAVPIYFEAGDRFLYFGENGASGSTAAGVYEVGTTAIAPARVADMPDNAALSAFFLFVEEGAHADVGYVQVNEAPLAGGKTHTATGGTANTKSMTFANADVANVNTLMHVAGIGIPEDTTVTAIAIGAQDTTITLSNALGVAASGEYSFKAGVGDVSMQFTQFSGGSTYFGDNVNIELLSGNRFAVVDQPIFMPTSSADSVKTTFGNHATDACKIFADGHITTGSHISADAFIAASDRKLKQDIEQIAAAEALGAILKIQPASYAFKNTPGVQRTGVIAQQLAEVVPHLVTHNKDNDHLQVNYVDMIAYLVGAVQGLQIQIASLNDE